MLSFFQPQGRGVLESMRAIKCGSAITCHLSQSGEKGGELGQTSCCLLDMGSDTPIRSLYLICCWVMSLAPDSSWATSADQSHPLLQMLHLIERPQA